MLSIAKVSADAGWDYLTRQISHATVDYYRADEVAGETPGQWVGSAQALLGLTGQVEEAQFKSLYVDHADPRTGETLGRTRRVYRSLAQRLTAVRAELAGATEEELAAAGRAVRRTDRVSVDAFDLTFSPVKSVSVLWAAGDSRLRGQVWAAQRAAVAAALDVLHDQAAYTRTGRHTSRGDARRRGRYEDADGLVGAAFEHRISRAGDPQVHTHVLLVNLTRTSSDGRWRTLDGDALYRAKDAAAGVYDQVLASELTRRLGVDWRLRTDGKAWEIDGIGGHVRRQFSARRVQITAQLAPLVDAFTAAHGRAPSGWELTRMSQWSTLTHRPGKTPPESTTDAARRWSAQFTAANGRLLADLPATVTGRTPAPPARLDIDAVADRAVERLAGKRATFDRADLAREVAFTLGGHTDPALTPAAVAARLDAITDAALARAGVVPVSAEELIVLPGQWCRRDGSSIFMAPHSTRYTVDSQLAAEAAVAAAAAEPTPLAADEPHVTAALAAYSGRTHNPSLTVEQRDAVTAIAGSGRRLSALVGPAGTGKTTTMDALCAVWRATIGGRVVGLSPSQIAADLLAVSASPDLAANTTRWLHHAATNPGRYGLHAGDLLIVDEASMVADSQLAALLTHATAADARVLLVGDPAQLPSPAAGAAYGMLTRQPGTTVHLGEVHRFHAGWEAPASLRLRAGDPTALDEYDRRARIHAGTREHAEEQAWAAWTADTGRGLTSLLITAAAADVTALNERARAARITAGHVDDNRTVPLADGTRAGAGDRIVTRRNQPTGDGRELVNRARWQVHTVHLDGSIDARPELADGTLGAPLRIPADYAAAHVELGYAATAYGAQGLSVDTAHAVVGIDGVDREALYVMASRGRQENHLYAQTRSETPDGKPLRPTTALAVLAGSLTRTAAQTSASETRAADADAVRSTATLAPIWETLAAGEAARRHTATLTAALPADTAARMHRDPATPALLREAFQAQIRGVDIDRLLRQAATSRSLSDADSVAQVLRWRLTAALTRHHPTGQWTGWTALTRPDPAAPETPTLTRAARLLDDRARQLAHQVINQPPEWALERLGPVPIRQPDRDAWHARAAAVATWQDYAAINHADPTVIGPQPTGPQPLAAVLWAAAHQALGRPDRTPDWHNASPAELHQLTRRADHAAHLAPPHVDRQLWTAHHELRHARTELGHLLSMEPIDNAAATPATAIDEAHARVVSRRAWVCAVEAKAERRAVWYAAAHDAISQGQRAQRELSRRAQFDGPGKNAALAPRAQPTPQRLPGFDRGTRHNRRRLPSRSRQLITPAPTTNRLPPASRSQLSDAAVSESKQRAHRL